MLFYGAAGGNTAQRIIAKPAALVLAGDDPAELTNHRVLVDPACKLTVGAVAVNFFTKQHKAAAFPFFFALYTMRPGKAMVYFIKNQQGDGAHQKRTGRG